MTLTNTELKILSKLENTIATEGRTLKESNLQQKSQEHGGRKICEEGTLTRKSPKQLKTETWLGNRALGVVKQNLLHTMKIMTSHLMLCGSANLVTNNVTKN